MNNHFILFSLVTTLLFFASCEGGTTFTKHLVNNSSETITVRGLRVIGPSDSTVIKPGESQLIYWDYTLGLFTPNNYDCVYEFDTFELGVSNGKILVKDIYDADNWSRESKGGRKSEENCTFTVTNDDLE